MNRPYDRAFKTVADGNPRGLLHLSGVLPVWSKAEVTPLADELRYPSVEADKIYRAVSGGIEEVVHLEAQACWTNDLFRRIVWTQGLLLQNYPKIAVRSIVLLLAEHSAPKNPPLVARFDDHGFHAEAPVSYQRLWEIDPAFTFKVGQESLLAWVPLLKTTDADLDRAAGSIRGHRSVDRQAAADMANGFVSMAGCRSGCSNCSARRSRQNARIASRNASRQAMHAVSITRACMPGQKCNSRSPVSPRTGRCMVSVVTASGIQGHPRGA